MRERTAKRCLSIIVWTLVASGLPRMAAADMMSPLLVGTGSATPVRGLLGWGVHVEFPVVGVVGDAPVHRQAGWGSLLGMAASMHVWEALEGRLQISRTHTYGGSMEISYASGNNRSLDNELAEWRAVLLALGATYVWGAAERPWAPYFGFDAVSGYGGYALTYTDDLARNLELPATQARTSVPTPHAGDAWLWGGQLRAGLRLQLAPWLATQTEIGATVVPMGALSVTNNREVRDVRTVPHTAILGYGAFLIRVTL